MTDQQRLMTGAFDGPFKNSVAAVIGSTLKSAARCGNPALYISAMLEEIRDVFSDDPRFLTAVVTGLLYFAEDRGMLDNAGIMSTTSLPLGAGLPDEMQPTS